MRVRCLCVASILGRNGPPSSPSRPWRGRLSLDLYLVFLGCPMKRRSPSVRSVKWHSWRKTFIVNCRALSSRRREITYRGQLGARQKLIRRYVVTLNWVSISGSAVASVFISFHRDITNLEGFFLAVSIRAGPNWDLGAASPRFYYVLLASIEFSGHCYWFGLAFRPSVLDVQRC